MKTAAALALALLPSALAAQDAVEAPGLLSDENFYRLVACAAPPDGDCAKPFLHWQTERPIRVALRRLDPAYLGRKKQRAEAALTRAVQALNGAEAGFRLARVAADAPAEIEFHFVDLEAGDMVTSTETGIAGPDGFALGEVSTRLVVDTDRDVILRATLIVSTTLKTSRYEAALLSALTRAMGLMTAVAGPAYRETSALAETGSPLTRLGPQDTDALQRHYAAPAR